MIRYYSSSLGRFMAVDPALTIGRNPENPQRWNRYTYSLNNPIKYFDPDGRDIKLSTKGDGGGAKKMLVQAAMRPSGRAALQSLDSNHGVTVTYQDTRINSPQQIEAAKQSGADVTTAKTSLVGETKDAQGNTTHYDVATKVDTKAVEQVHPDPSGATTVGHEAVHAEDIAAGKSDPELEAGEPEADAAGKKVGAEKPDISKQEAKKIVNEMLKN